MSPEKLLAYLDELGIATRTVRHPAVYTVEQAREHRRGLTGGFTKNLFLRNKKGQMLLVVAEESRPLHLKTLGRGLGAGNLSFASAERLRRYLGLEPGAVSPFGLVNDTEGAVSVVIDKQLQALDPLHFHPLDNTMTTAISPGDLFRFIEATGHAFQLVDLEPYGPP